MFLRSALLIVRSKMVENGRRLALPYDLPPCSVMFAGRESPGVRYDERHHVSDSENGTTTIELAEKYKFMKRLVGRLATEVSLDGGFSDEEIYGFMENILSAETEEEVFARQTMGDMVASKDYLNKPFYLTSENIKWMKSSFQGGFPFYAILKVTDAESGAEVTIDGGGVSFCAVLAKLQDLRAFDGFEETKGRPMQLIGKPTSSGNTVVLVQPLPTAARKRNGKG